MTGRRQVCVFELGRVEYEDGLQLQHLEPDTLLLVEHPPVITLGRGAKAANLLASPLQLEERGVRVFETNRGGDVTYHGPGQVVGYPVLQLEGADRDVRKYVKNLEEVMIRAAAAFGFTARRIAGWTGVWIDDPPRKVGAIGVHLSRWRTSHGFAFNADVDLAPFGLIVPCGIREAGVASLGVSPADARRALLQGFAEVFEADLFVRAPSQTVCVVVTRADQVLLLQRPNGVWQPVTGRVEAAERVESAARRECREETGFGVVPEPLGYVHAFGYGEPLQVVEETAFLARVPVGAEPTLSEEHKGYQWLAAKDAVDVVPYAGLKEAIRRAVRPTPA